MFLVDNKITITLKNVTRLKEKQINTSEIFCAD